MIVDKPNLARNRRSSQGIVSRNQNRFNACLLRWYEVEEKANRARIKAETSSEYVRKREARDLKELALEMIGTLKYLLRAYSEEMRLAR